MQVTTVSEFRNNIKEFMSAVRDNSEEVIIAGPKGCNVVVISLEEYEAMKETNHLYSTKANADALHESLQQLKQGRVVVKSLDELDAML